jgi:hypothetical protein
MTIREIVEQGFFYARTCRSLWLFGFFIGVASNGTNGGGRGGDQAGGGLALGGLWSVFGTEIAIGAGLLVVALVVAGFVMRFLSEGALIEGIVRARRGGTMTTREGFRAGWAHWGVILRIWLVYIAAAGATVVVLLVPCALAWWAFGPLPAILLGVPALLVAVPWFVTLSLVQAFALRIAVLEQRDALDAIAKARLFLHGRLVHGLKLMVADFVGSLGLIVLSLVAIVPILLLCMALALVFPLVPVIIAGALVVVPVTSVCTAILGTFRSSVWTIGYLSQVEA